MRKYLGLFLGLVSSGMLAQAALIPTLQATGPGSSPGTTSYFYTVSLASDQRVDTDNPATLTIFGFDGYVDGSLIIGTGVGSWSGVAQAVGDTFNLVFTYSGPLVNGPEDPIFDFFADSIFSEQKVGAYQGTASKNSINPIEDGLPTGNTGSVGVPVGDAGVPEPATLSLVGGALVGLALFRRKRAK